jgi:hypothetical protein
MEIIMRTVPLLRLLYLELFIGLAVCGCSGETAASASLENIAVTGFGADSGGEFCSDFRLSTDEARQFFKRAAEVDATTIHDKFDTLPCYVRGTGTWQGKSATWMVRAGGTAEVTTEAATVLLACSSCDELFGGEKQK